MVEPLSPDHVFDFPADNPTLDAEDPDMEVEEDPEEMPEEDPEEVIPPIVASPHGSPPISPPPLLESSSNYEFTAPGTTNGTLWVPPSGSTFEPNVWEGKVVISIAQPIRDINRGVKWEILVLGNFQEAT
ncbi:hypothetical protein Tco_1353236 [Tanacetum coccineum]